MTPTSVKIAQHDATRPGAIVIFINNVVGFIDDIRRRVQKSPMGIILYYLKRKCSLLSMVLPLPERHVQ
jgi:hypothetical protein